MAVARHHAQLAFTHAFGQALACQQQVTAVALVRPAQRHAVGPRHAAHTLGEAVGQLLQAGGVGHQAGHVVERLQAFAFFFQLRGLLGHLGLQPAVHRLQVFGHAVEAFGQRSELVAAWEVDAGAEVAVLDLVGGVFQQPHRFQHQHVADVQQHRCPQHGERHRQQLQQVQLACPVRHGELDVGHKRVDVVAEAGGFFRQPLHRAHRSPDPALAEGGPVLLDIRKVRVNGVVPGHEKGPLGVALAQHGQALVERLGLARQRRNVTRAHRERHAVSLHAHAPRFVDRGRPSVELPRHPQRRRHQQQRQQQEGRGREHQARAQAPVLVACHGQHCRERRAAPLDARQGARRAGR